MAILLRGSRIFAKWRSSFARESDTVRRNCSGRCTGLLAFNSSRGDRLSLPAVPTLLESGIVKSAELVKPIIVLLLLAGFAPMLARVGAQSAGADPGAWFARGETALRANNLDAAEAAFRRVVAIDPKAAGAYANLGVIEMRRKHWSAALVELRRAEKLAPDLAGIRLNIGLVYFHQQDYRAAIAPFESVVKDTPDSSQASYLLGLCDFFTQRYADAAAALEPLWDRESNNLSYLYVLGIAPGGSWWRFAGISFADGQSVSESQRRRKGSAGTRAGCGGRSEIAFRASLF